MNTNYQSIEKISTYSKNCMTMKRVFEIITQFLFIISSGSFVLAILNAQGIVIIEGYLVSTNLTLYIINLSLIGLSYIAHIWFELTSVFFKHLINHKTKKKFEAIFTSLQCNKKIAIQIKDDDGFIIQNIEFKDCKDATKYQLNDIIKTRSVYLNLQLVVYFKDYDYKKFQSVFSEHKKMYPNLYVDLFEENHEEFLIINSSESSTWKYFHIILFIFLCIIGLGELYRIFVCCCVQSKIVQIEKFVSGVNEKPNFNQLRETDKIVLELNPLTTLDIKNSKKNDKESDSENESEENENESSEKSASENKQDESGEESSSSESSERAKVMTLQENKNKMFNSNKNDKLHPKNVFNELKNQSQKTGNSSNKTGTNNFIKR